MTKHLDDIRSAISKLQDQRDVGPPMMMLSGRSVEWLVNEVARQRALLDEAVGLLGDVTEEYVDACHQGSGNEPLSFPQWHNFMSTYEYADKLIPKARAFLDRVRVPETKEG